MRTLLFFTWLAIPVAALAWHFGPGQKYLAGDTAARHLARAEQAAAEQDWTTAAAAYTEALATLPAEERPQQRRLRLAGAAARIQAGDLPEGQSELEGLLAELEAPPADAQASPPDPELLAAVRHELASSSYHAAWLLRLEGAGPEEWLPECEQARQQFRLLAEAREAAGGDAEAMKRNLESAIRLERMDLATLLAAPKPKDCPNCKNLGQRKRKQSQSRSQAQSKGDSKGDPEKQDPEKQDARKSIKQDNAGMGGVGGKGS
jgi:hypothetical protein